MQNTQNPMKGELAHTAEGNRRTVLVAVVLVLGGILKPGIVRA